MIFGFGLMLRVDFVRVWVWYLVLFLLLNIISVGEMVLILIFGVKCVVNDRVRLFSLVLFV